MKIYMPRREALNRSLLLSPQKEPTPPTPWFQTSGLQNCETINSVVSGFPGGAVVESLPANAGDTGSSPGLGGSHMPRSGWAREPQLLSLRVWSLCSATGEAAIVRGLRTAMRSGPRLPQLERALAQRQRPNTAKNKKIKKKKILIKKNSVVSISVVLC